jgi:hypothetical protein
MANIWFVAADTSFAALPVNFQQLKITLGLQKNHAHNGTP